MSFPRYPDYKDSGVEWLGQVPAAWRVAPLKAVSSHNDDVLDDTTPPDTAITYVDISGVDGVRGIKTKESLIFAAAPSRARRLVKHGDVIVSTVRTYLKAIATIRNPEPNLVVSTGFAVIRPNAAITPDFLGYLISSSYVVEQVIARSTGVSYPAINASELVSIPIPLPPIDEQTHITAFLDSETAKIDMLVAEQRSLIELLKKKRQAVIVHAVTKGLNPSAPMNPSGIQWLGEVPAHWDVRPLKHLVSFRSGGTPSKTNITFWDGAVPWASSKDLKREELSDTQDHITQVAIDQGAAEFVPRNSLLIVVRGMILAHTFPVVKALVPMAINQDLKALTPRAELDVDYLAWLLRGSSAETISRTDEAAHGTKVIRMEAWTSMDLPVPPLREQRAIVVSIVSQMAQIDVQAAASQRAMHLLNERRVALVSASVTGQIDVRGLAESIAA